MQVCRRCELNVDSLMEKVHRLYDKSLYCLALTSIAIKSFESLDTADKPTKSCAVPVVNNIRILSMMMVFASRILVSQVYQAPLLASSSTFSSTRTVKA